MEEREAKLEVSKNVPGKRTSSHDSYLFMCFPHKKKHRRSYQKKNWRLNVWRLHSGIVLCDMGKNTHRKTPQERNMEPNNAPLEKEKHLFETTQSCWVFGFHASLGGGNNFQSPKWEDQISPQSSGTTYWPRDGKVGFRWLVIWTPQTLVKEIPSP